jgi:hypothetical protein
MLGSGAVSRGRMSVTTCGPRDRDAEIYDLYAAGLYRQALLTLDDTGAAEQVVCDVLVDECVWHRAAVADGDNASCRLAVSAYWRCLELAAGPGWRDHPSGQRPPRSLARCIQEPYRLSRKERGALGLVLFGGLSSVQASRELAISPLEMVGILRAVLLRLTTARAGHPTHLSGTAEP